MTNLDVVFFFQVLLRERHPQQGGRPTPRLPVLYRSEKHHWNQLWRVVVDFKSVTRRSRGHFSSSLHFLPWHVWRHSLLGTGSGAGHSPAFSLMICKRCYTTQHWPNYQAAVLWRHYVVVNDVIVSPYLSLPLFVPRQLRVRTELWIRRVRVRTSLVVTSDVFFKCTVACTYITLFESVMAPRACDVILQFVTYVVLECWFVKPYFNVLNIFLLLFLTRNILLRF